MATAIASHSSVTARAESELRVLSWNRTDAVSAARARAALRILHGVPPAAAGEALAVDLWALTAAPVGVGKKGIPYE